MAQHRARRFAGTKPLDARRLGDGLEGLFDLGAHSIGADFDAELDQNRADFFDVDLHGTNLMKASAPCAPPWPPGTSVETSGPLR